MASKALVKLLNTKGVLAQYKTQISKKIIEFIEPTYTELIIQTSYKSGRKLKYFNEEIDNIPSYYGISAFYNNFSKEYCFENILIAYDEISLKALKSLFTGIKRGKKKILVYSGDSLFYKVVLKIRTLFSIWRDINTNMNILKISEIIQFLIDIIQQMMDEDSQQLLTFSSDKIRYDIDSLIIYEDHVKYLN